MEQQNITAVKGVGEKTAKLFQKIGVETVEELLHYYPRAYDEFKEPQPIEELKEDTIAAVGGILAKTADVVRYGARLQVTTAGLRDSGGTLALAWRAIHPMLPKNKDTFPYTIRVVSEIMESNGSSSMATVCGTTMSLMAAGVPMEKPVAGIAMGLIKEDDGRVAVLTDILGDEDHLGDMDFKVAGTKDGVTALQMDIKITSITKEIMQTALAQAHEGRIHILGEMAKAIAEPRPHVSDRAPRIIAIKIPVDKIREVIGSGGKVIREITEKTNTKIDIADDGVIKIASVKKEDGEAALEWIMGIVAEPEEGKIYHGVITKIMDFGAFVRFLGTTEGLVHISEVKNERIASVSDFYKEGDSIWVKCLGTDNRGKIKLSAKRVNQENGEDLEK